MAAATAGLAGFEHMPKVVRLTSGWWSRMVATGSAEQVTPVAGGISKGQGEVPKEQRQVLPEVIRVGILGGMSFFG